MRPRITKPQNRIDSIIENLSAIYEINIRVVRVYFNRYNQNVSVTKMHLKRIYDTGNELSFINDINLSY